MMAPALPTNCIRLLPVLHLLNVIMQVPLSKLKDSFNDGTSIAYIEELEQRYKADPSSVDKTWGMFFKALGELQGLMICH
jgi:hypothetical protein